jgi:hypothetical protein
MARRLKYHGVTRQMMEALGSTGAGSMRAIHAPRLNAAQPTFCVKKFAP